jgi:putative membrane protein
VQQLVDYMGSCERILLTPLPFAYVAHLRWALIVYAATLPLALVEGFGWWSLLAVFLIAWVLFGIEEIGVEIESPFGTDANDLPLERIVAGIDRVLQEWRGRDAAGQPIARPESRAAQKS